LLRLAVSTLRARKARALLAAAAITLGVAFMSATLVLTDTLSQAYTDVTASATSGTDLVVRSSQAQTSANLGTTVRAPINAGVLNDVRRTPGVAAAEADIQGIAQIVRSNGKLIDDNNNRPTPIALSWHPTAALNPMKLVAGHAPTANEVVIDKHSASIAALHVGDRVGVLTPDGATQMAIAGIATYGGHADAAGAQVAAFAPDTAARLFGRPDAYDSIRVAAAKGTTPQQLTQSLQSAFAQAHAQHVEVVTGATVAKEARDASQKNVSFLAFLLTAFALVSLLVGSMVIANAFAITAAHRTRENALLRALGAKRSQVTRAVMAEAALTGAAASIIGVVIGIGTAKLLQSLVEVIGVPLPKAPLVVSGKVFVIGLVVGTLVTMIASYLPARRAGRTAPIAAMRDAGPGMAQGTRKRAVIGTIVAAIGVLAISRGVATAPPAQVGEGARAVVAALLIVGPVIGPFVVRISGAAVQRAGWTTGEVA